MKESQDKEIVIDDIKASTFEALLSYIYGREFEIKQDLALDLYELTDKWVIKDLNNYCKDVLIQHFTLENIGEITRRAEDLGSDELHEAVADFLLDFDVIPEEKDLDLPPSVLKKVICKFKAIQKKAKKH